MNLAELVAAGRFREDLFYRLKVLAVRLPPLRERPADIDLIADHVLKACTREMGAHVNGLSLAARRILQTYRWPGNIRELKYAIEAAVTLCGDSSFIEPVHLPPELQSLAPRHTGAHELVALPAHATPPAHPQPFGAHHPGAPHGYGMAPGGASVSQPAHPSPGPMPVASEAERSAATEDALQVVFRLDGSMALADLERVALERAMEYSDGNQVRAAKLLGVSRDLLRYRLKKFGLIE
ncbi:MAG: hypothetical protein HY902_21370 [Deltaproteobacteria bacterium]|nr:hypothetical protein [Deltaproteobacteria bacterium]